MPNIQTGNITEAQTRAITALSDLSPPETFWEDLAMGVEFVRSHPNYRGCLVPVENGTITVSQQVLNKSGGGAKY